MGALHEWNYVDPANDPGSDDGITAAAGKDGNGFPLDDPRRPLRSPRYRIFEAALVSHKPDGIDWGQWSKASEAQDLPAERQLTADEYRTCMYLRHTPAADRLHAAQTFADVVERFDVLARRGGWVR